MRDLKSYPMRIYAVYIGTDHTVKVFEYPAKPSKIHPECIECAVYLHKVSMPKFGMVKLPSKEFYKVDFEKKITLADCTVIYFLKKTKAQNTAQREMLNQFKLLREEIANAQKQAEKIKRKIEMLQTVKNDYEKGAYSIDPELVLKREYVKTSKNAQTKV